MNIPVRLFRALQRRPKPLLLGISGFRGSGTNMLANTLADRYNAPIISLDAFMTDRTLSRDLRWNASIDFNRLQDEVLRPFTHNLYPIKHGCFDLEANTITHRATVDHHKVLIVEGPGLFRPNTLPFFGYTIWIDTPIDIAHARGKKRDLEEESDLRAELWDTLWKKNDVSYFKKHQPIKTADFVLSDY